MAPVTGDVTPPTGDPSFAATSTCSAKTDSDTEMADGDTHKCPTVLVLTLQPFRNWSQNYDELLKKLSAKATVHRRVNVFKALDYLKAKRPTAILIADSGVVSRKNSNNVALTKAIVEYPKDGGRTVLACDVTWHVSKAALDAWFEKGWNLPWKCDWTHEAAEVSRNPIWCPAQGPLPFKVGDLPDCEMEADDFLEDIGWSQAVFVFKDDLEEDPPDHTPQAHDLCSAPVVYLGFGNGWVGFVGSQDCEADKIMLRFCGL